MKILRLIGICGVLSSSLYSLNLQAQMVARPAQYVLMAFDGSYEPKMWKATMNFSDTMKASGKTVKFTYFVSGVYYLAEANRFLYHEPSRGKGRSAIGWGDDAADIKERVRLTDLAFMKGHEIASHANSHYSGDQWSEAQWTSEISQFYKILFSALSLNGIAADPALPTGLHFTKKEVIGFRAPLLGVSAGLWPTLKKMGFRYDTSKTSPSNYWPKKNSYGTWNFPLAELRIAGTAKRVLSMDYNFYYQQSGGQPNPSLAKTYEDQMFKTYMNYFNSNYNGNRAPVHIGHHFSLWNGGAYWKAMQRFASAVCGQPEVKCVTYTELMKALEKTGPNQVLAYQWQNFPQPASFSPMAEENRPLEIDTHLSKNQQSVILKLTGKDQKAVSRMEWQLNGQQVQSLKVASLLDAIKKGERATVAIRLLSKNGDEILSQTYSIATTQDLNTLENLVPLENRAWLGDLPEAHKE